MRKLADGVWQLDGFPRDTINVYIVEDVLIDSGTVLDRRRVLNQLQGRPLTAHAVTHAHFDHFGSSRAVCERFGIPLWVGEHDVEMVQAGKMLGPGGRAIPRRPAATLTAGSGRETRWPGFRCSTRPGTRLVTSRSGATQTGCSYAAMSSGAAIRS